jgi:hypothetical protein
MPISAGGETIMLGSGRGIGPQSSRNGGGSDH